MTLPDWILRQGCNALGLLLLPLGMFAAADPGRVDKTVNTTANPRITLGNLSGHVVVRGWSRQQVHYLFTTLSPHLELDTVVLPESPARAEKIHFSTNVIDAAPAAKDQTADYAVEVPIGSTVEIINRQGSVLIDNLQGDAAAESVGSAIIVKDVAGHLSVRSVGGNIELIHPSGRVEASSITGSLHFISPSSLQVKGVTTSGKILFEGDLVSDGDYQFSSYNSDIDILCPPSSSFELNVKTVRGTVDNALALTTPHHYGGPISTGESIFGKHNTGNATLTIKSFSGAIHIRGQN